jgi:putative ABC transport system substrate-binding protein
MKGRRTLRAVDSIARSRLLAALALFAATLAFDVAAQTRKVAILEHGDKTGRAAGWRVFEERLRQLGYVEGKNLMLARRWADGVDARLPALVQELIAGAPEVIVVNTTPATQAVMQATKTLPIVFIGPADPVAAGLVASLARPGGNVTGLSAQLVDVNEKRLELMREIAPQARRFALLGPDNEGVRAVLKRLQAATHSMGVEVHFVEASDAAMIERAFGRLRTEGVDALLVASALVQHYRLVVGLAEKHRIPASYIHKEALEVGALLVFGPDTSAYYRRAAEYAHRILSGAKPGELPVEQPRAFWLGVNQRTAKALGLSIPSSVLLSADRVIE